MSINFLKIPLNKLYFIADVGSFDGLSKDELSSMKEEYDDEEIRAIMESVKWATENPDYDFSSLLPNLHQSNKDIYQYLCKLDNSLSTHMTLGVGN